MTETVETGNPSVVAGVAVVVTTVVVVVSDER